MEKIITTIMNYHFVSIIRSKSVSQRKKSFSHINIFRVHETKRQTLGYCWVKNQNGSLFPPNIFFTLELPWLDNRRNVSRIPPGEYVGEKYKSPKFKRWVIMLENVSKRDHIEIHPMTYHWNTEGCIGVAYDLADFNQDKEPDLKNSGKALDRILDLVPNTMTISIRDCFNEV